MPAQRLAGSRFPFRFLPHQRAAIKAYDSSSDPTRCYLILPPGAGKTLVGAEIARRAGRRTVVLVPNTAVQGQWVQQWHLLGTDIVTVAEDLSATADITVLTYQDIATCAGDVPFDSDRTDPGDAPAQSPRLRPDAADFLRRLAAGPPFTLVLDEAHHLAATCGDVLDEVMTAIETQDQGQSNPIVIALSATPRDRLTSDQRELTEHFFGPLLFTASTPALVRDQSLAPFRELVRFATPTEAERDYLRHSSRQWRDLIAGLVDPDFADVSFIDFLNNNWVHRTAQPGNGFADSAELINPAAPASWQSIERTHPEIARALLRLHFDSHLIDLPDGAQLTEKHRQPPAAEDWLALISDYGRRALVTSESAQDNLAWEQVCTVLRSVGWTLTSSGFDPEQTLVDVVLRRSAAKADAAVNILQHEWELRGRAMRAAILTDSEYSAATDSPQLSDVLSHTAGTAYDALLQTDRTLPDMRPVLVTGTTVAGSVETMNHLVEFIANGNPKLADGLRSAPVPETDGLVALSGPGWHPRVWLPIVTGWFLAGGTHVLVGTRDLLGEGWDAASLNVLVDLTTTTTATAVVQIRGRALRKDPADSRKSAHIWSVVVVSDDHPSGDLDYRRFVAKHRGFRAADSAGRVLAGAPHVDPECGPFSPPSPKMRTAVNIRMMEAATRQAELPLLWGLDRPYADTDAPVAQVRGLEGEALDLGVPQASLRPWARTRGLVPVAGASVGALLPILAAAPPAQALVWASVGGVTGWGADAGSRMVARRRAEARMSAGDTLLAIGKAVAQGMDLDPDQVSVAPDGDDVWLALYARNDDQLGMNYRGQQDFASAMEQVLSPVSRPPYLVSRILPKKKTTVWHAVPDSLGRNLHSANGFLKAWVEFVSDGRLVDTKDPDGADVLDTVRGLNPGNVSVGIRVEWH